jgi:uncharacterized protein YecT (DUF1311 family)
MRSWLLLFPMILCAAGDAPVETAALDGMWWGHCSWGANIQRSREHRRILRAIDRDTIAILEWIEASEWSDDPALRGMNTEGFVVMKTPVFVVVKRTGPGTFGQGDFHLTFTREGGTLRMQPGDADACVGFGGEYELEREAGFGRFRPSFACAKARQPREQAICGNAELAMLDQHLNASYRAAQQRVRIAEKTKARRAAKLKELADGQSAWWSGELAKCQSGDCVAPLYTARIRYLDSVANGSQ